MALAGGLGHEGGREEGKRGREVRGFDSPLDLREGGPQGGAPRRRAAAGSGRCGGGAAGPGGGRG